MSEMLIRYTGPYKITAIKAVRTVFDVTLKEAKDAVESASIRVSSVEFYAIVGAYVTHHGRIGAGSTEATHWENAAVFDLGAYRHREVA